MEKLEEFKQFVKTIPNIKQDVLDGRYTWQQLYEIYVMYGSDDKFWQGYKNNSSVDIIDMIKNIDVNALTNSLNAIEKVLQVASGLLSKPKEEEIPRTNKWYDE